VDGRPAGNVAQLEPEVFLWIVEEHLVIYRRIEPTQVLRVIVLKPAT
jgi:hypothetical protein